MLARLAQSAQLVEKALADYLPAPEGPHAELLAAMRYAVLNGGKRLRPALVLAACETFGGDPDQALPAACAVELAHCFSLVHDDLPAIDDDELRRGKPTVHKQFDEPTALLAGDALLAFAFDLLARELPAKGVSAESVVHCVALLGRAIGPLGVCGGEFVDIVAEGREFTETELDFIHERKTAILIEAALQLGAVIAGASEDQVAIARTYGHYLGLLFQASDDLLGEIGDEAKLGKPVGRDKALGKATAVRLLGVDGTRRRLAELAAFAREYAAALGELSDFFLQLVDFVVERES